MTTTTTTTTTTTHADAAPFTRLTVTTAGLFRRQFTVDAASTVRRVEQAGLHATAIGIEIRSDDVVEFVHLAYAAWIARRPELDAAIDAVLTEAQAAIAALQPATKSIAYDRTTGDSDGERTLNNLAYAQLTHAQGSSTEADDTDALFPPLITPPAPACQRCGATGVLLANGYCLTCDPLLSLPAADGEALVVPIPTIGTPVRVENPHTMHYGRLGTVRRVQQYADGATIYVQLDGEDGSRTYGPGELSVIDAPAPPEPIAPLLGQVRYVRIDSVALVAAYEAAQAQHPDTSKGWGKAIRAAYEYLIDIWQDEGSATFIGDVLLAESEETPGTIYLSNGSCTCPAGKRAQELGRVCICKHRARRQIIVRMGDEVARTQAAEAVLGQRLADARAQVEG